jgi:hypothetical protein
MDHQLAKISQCVLRLPGHGNMVTGNYQKTARFSWVLGVVIAEDYHVNCQIHDDFIDAKRSLLYEMYKEKREDIIVGKERNLDQQGCTYM